MLSSHSGNSRADDNPDLSLFEGSEHFRGSRGITVLPCEYFLGLDLDYDPLPEPAELFTLCQVSIDVGLFLSPVAEVLLPSVVKVRVVSVSDALNQYGVFSNLRPFRI